MYIKVKFGSALVTHRVNVAYRFFKMGRPMAPQIGPNANVAGSRVRSGSAHSHPEP
jgi:hypothetical protein